MLRHNSCTAGLPPRPPHASAATAPAPPHLEPVEIVDDIMSRLRQTLDACKLQLKNSGTENLRLRELYGKALAEITKLQKVGPQPMQPAGFIRWA